MKQTLMIILLIITLINIGGCVNMDGIHVKVNNESIYLDNKANGTSNDKKDIFKFAFEKDTIKEIQIVNLGEKVFLDFENNSPDKINITDRILSPTGELMYTDRETVKVSLIKENDNNYSFTLVKHPASLLSSFYIENKTDFRGYEITVLWGKKEYVYYFVLKTDSE